jgi:hypothetical protein
MNIARLFAYTRFLETELRRERILRRRDELRHTRERQNLMDAVQRNANKQPVFEKTVPPKVSNVSSVAFGPTMSAARQKAKEQEIVERAQAASNGSKINAPEIPSE